MRDEDKTREQLLDELRALRRQSAEDRRRTSDLLRAVAEGTIDAVFVKDLHGRYLFVNPAGARFVGRSVAEVLGKDDRDLFDRDSALLLMKLDRRVMELGRTETHEERLTVAGVTRTYQATKGPYRDHDGRVAGLIGISRDVTERKDMEEALRRSEERYRSVVEGSFQGIAIHQDERVRFANGALARAFGYDSAGELLGLPTDALVAPEELPVIRARRAACLGGEGDLPPHEWQGVRKDGSLVWVESTVAAIDWNGRPALLSFYLDISERKRLEEQYLQAQKMEAVGRLAGGVAHDFNNLLTVINGYSQVLGGLLHGHDEARALAEHIARAGERAAALTRQLLAFSRKQVLQPRVLDLNELVAGLVEMLPRLLGEDVELSAALAPDLRRVRADAGQIEQVVMNLAVNARDAMPQGGRLTIATANVDLGEEHAAAHPTLSLPGSGPVPPGPYVLLAVSDTGCGMDRPTRERLFEPFFTTKEVGKGTGLGLATVYGIVQQSNGHIEVSTEIGRGTTFRIYLPDTRDEARPAPGAAPAPVPRGGETVLVVEDEEGVRGLTSHLLKLGGYEVLAAATAADALAVAAAHRGPLHLLVTDVVMPQMSGRELARRLGAVRPGVRVLYVSGYTDDGVLRHGVLQEAANFLQKPFALQTLARKVREVLDGRA